MGYQCIVDYDYTRNQIRDNNNYGSYLIDNVWKLVYNLVIISKNKWYCVKGGRRERYNFNKQIAMIIYL